MALRRVAAQTAMPLVGVQGGRPVRRRRREQERQGGWPVCRPGEQRCGARVLASSGPVLRVLLLLLWCCCFAAVAARQLQYSTAKPEEGVCAIARETARTGGQVTVPLNHRHGPCSPVASNSKQPSLEELLRLDELRADYVQRGAGGLEPSEVHMLPTVLGSGFGTLEYVVSIGIGSPPFGQTIVMDTGSDVSWVRCNTQVGRPFDPRASNSYSPFSCSSGECALLGEEGTGCSDGQCQYAVKYYDGSYTTGTYGHDMLALTDSEAIKSFEFGCSHTDGFDDRLDGLLGLGGGAQSLTSQTAAIYGSQFSYCLPPTPVSSGFLTLGAPGEESSFVTTPMFRITKHLTFYYVLLWGINVAEKPLDLPPSVFGGGSVLDSGTVITRLPTAAYAALSAAFKEEMKEYSPGQPSGILDTCFDFGGQERVMIPRVALVFDDGVVVELDANGIMIGSCLAFAATNDIGIIGNVQQRTLEVLYDVGQSRVGFRAGAC